jgi:hypothetical protein
MARVWLSDNTRVGFGGSPSLSILTGISQGVLAKRQQEEDRKRQEIINRLNETQARTMEISSEINQAREAERVATFETRKAILDQELQSGKLDYNQRVALQKKSEELDAALEAAMPEVARRLLEFNPKLGEAGAMAFAGVMSQTDAFKEAIGGLIFGESQQAQLQNTQRAGRQPTAAELGMQVAGAMTKIAAIQMPGEEPQLSAYFEYMDAAAKGDLPRQMAAYEVMAGAVQSIPGGGAALGQLLERATPDAGRGGISAEQQAGDDALMEENIRAEVTSSAKPKKFRDEKGEMRDPTQQMVDQEQYKVALEMYNQAYEAQQARQNSPGGMAGALDPQVVQREYTNRMFVLRKIMDELQERLSRYGSGSLLEMVMDGVSNGRDDPNYPE